MARGDRQTRPRLASTEQNVAPLFERREIVIARDPRSGPVGKGTAMSVVRERSGSTITVKDGTQIYYKDWGTGQPVVFSHGWPLTADAWEDQMVFLGPHGYRCIAHDRRGHGRSSQPWDGNDMDTYADDLAALVDGARPARRDPRRPLDRRRRGGALHRPPRHAARRQGRADRRGAAAHAEDGRQSRRPADRDVRRHPRRRRSPTGRSSSRT